MSFVSKILNSVFDFDGNSSTHISSTSFGSRGNAMSDFEAPKIGNDTFVHDGKTYTRIGNSLFGSNGKTWTGNSMDDDTVRGIINNDGHSGF